MIQTLISICATPCLVGKCSLSCPFRKRACVQRVSAWCCQAETSHTCRTVRREGEAQPHGATRSFLSQLEFQCVPFQQGWTQTAFLLQRSSLPRGGRRQPHCGPEAWPPSTTGKLRPVSAGCTVCALRLQVGLPLSGDSSFFKSFHCQLPT